MGLGVGCKLMRGVNAVAVADGGGSVVTYPTLSDPLTQLLWIDCDNNCYTDAVGVTPAATGEAVRTILLPSGWDRISVGGKLSQATLGNRPTKGADGLYGNGTSSVMSLPARMSLNTEYTFYWIGARGANGRQTMPLGSGSATLDGIGIDSSGDNNCYVVDESTSVAMLGASDNTLCIRRIRRAVGGITYYKRPGAAEVSTTDGADTLNFDSFLARLTDGVYTHTACRIRHVVMVMKDLANGADNTLVINSLLAKVPTAAW